MEQDLELAYSTPKELAEIERQSAVRASALSDAETKKEKEGVQSDPEIPPRHVWCPLRHQFIDTVVCARMQSQNRIINKCRRCRCRWVESWWAVKLTKERRKDDPRDHSLGYLRTEQYRITTTKRRVRKIDDD